MTRQEILDQLTQIFQDILDVDDLVVTDALKADDVEEWESRNTGTSSSTHARS